MIFGTNLPGRHRSSCRFFGLSFGGCFPRGWVCGRRRRYRLSFFHCFGRGRRFILLFNSRNLVVLAGLPRHCCRHFSHLHLGDKKIYLTSPSKQKFILILVNPFFPHFFISSYSLLFLFLFLFFLFLFF